jgi:hypothetical protein
MTKEIDVIGFVAAGCLLGIMAGAQLDWCDRGEVCRAVLPHLPHGPHNDHRPGEQQVYAISIASSTASSSSSNNGGGGAGILPITVA